MLLIIIIIINIVTCNIVFSQAREDQVFRGQPTVYFLIIHTSQLAECLLFFFLQRLERIKSVGELRGLDPFHKLNLNRGKITTWVSGIFYLFSLYLVSSPLQIFLFTLLSNDVIDVFGNHSIQSMEIHII